MRRYYTGMMIGYTIFLIYMMFYGSGREASEIGYIQINPLQTVRHFCGDNIKLQDFMVNIVGNIFAFSPFGWLGILFKKLFKIGPLAIVFMIAISIIEFSQYYTGRGTADIDDIILNTFGMLLGYATIKLFTAINAFNFRTYFYEEEFETAVA